MTTINIGGKERAFNFSFKAIRSYCESQDIKVSEFFADIQLHTKNIVDSIEAFLHAGLQAAEKDSALTIEEVKEWVGELSIPELTKLMGELSKGIIDSVTTAEPKKAAEEATA